MNINQLNYRSAAEVLDFVSYTSAELSDAELKAILCNALRRIQELEQALAAESAASSRAANIASCLANGIQPD